MANQIIYIDITFWKLGNIKFIGLSPSFFFAFFSILNQTMNAKECEFIWLFGDLQSKLKNMDSFSRC